MAASGSQGEKMQGVLNVGDLGFGYVEDTQMLKSRCDFWRELAAAFTSLGGYAPPGAIVTTNLVNVTNDPSANFGH